MSASESFKEADFDKKHIDSDCIIEYPCRIPPVFMLDSMVTECDKMSEATFRKLFLGTFDEELHHDEPKPLRMDTKNRGSLEV